MQYGNKTKTKPGMCSCIYMNLFPSLQSGLWLFDGQKSMVYHVYIFVYIFIMSALFSVQFFLSAMCPVGHWVAQSALCGSCWCSRCWRVIGWCHYWRRTTTAPPSLFFLLLALNRRPCTAATAELVLVLVSVFSLSLLFLSWSFPDFFFEIVH